MNLYNIENISSSKIYIWCKIISRFFLQGGKMELLHVRDMAALGEAEPKNVIVCI